MAIVTRLGKGSKLTIEEMDNNLLSLESGVSDNVSAITSKLDKGAYTGSAKDLDNAIAASVSAITSKLDKGTYTGTAKDLENAIVAAVTGASGISIVPTSAAPAGTGISSFTATQAGTYTNYGGVVVNANSFAIISRSSTNIFSISQTAFVLTDYAKFVDVSTRIMSLTAGSYHNSTSARAAVPTLGRFLGLKISYSTSIGVWKQDQFVGNNINTWADNDSWLSLDSKVIKNTINIFDNSVLAFNFFGYDGYKIINGVAGDVFRLNKTPFAIREYNTTGTKLQDIVSGTSITIQETNSYVLIMFLAGTNVSELVVTKNNTLPTTYLENINVDTKYISGYKDVVSASNFVNKDFVSSVDRYSNIITITNVYKNDGTLATLGGSYKRSNFFSLGISNFKDLEYYLYQGISAPSLIFFDANNNIILSSIKTVSGTSYVSGSFTKTELLALYPTAEYVIIQTNGSADSFLKIRSYAIPKQPDYVVDSTGTIVLTNTFDETPKVFFTLGNSGSYAYANNTYLTTAVTRLKGITIQANTTGTISIYSIDINNPTNNVLLISGIAVVAGVNVLNLIPNNLSFSSGRYVVVKGSASQLLKTWNTGVNYNILTYDSGANSAFFNAVANAVAYTVEFEYDQITLNLSDGFKFSAENLLADFQSKNSAVYNVKTPLNHTSDLHYKRGARLSVDSEYTPLLLVMGQSNTDGRAPNNTIPANIVDVDSKLPKFKMWNHGTNVFSDYQLGVNVGSNNVNGTTPNNYKAFGYDVFFAKKYLTDNPSKTLYCIKTSKGATGIYNGGEWDPIVGLQSFNYMNRIAKALKWGKANNIKFMPICILYHQGEWDADMGTPGVNAYKQNVSNLFGYFKGMIGAPNIPIINGQCSQIYNGGSYVPINNIFAELNVIDPYFKTVDMTANQTFIDSSIDGLGNIHYDVTALKFMGESMYVKYKLLNLE
jgi:hypothetical protein